MDSQSTFKDNREAARMGVKIAMKLLRLDGLKLEFHDAEYFPTPFIGSMFLEDSFIITFNNAWLEKAAMAEVLASAFHEVRHAYQQAAIEFPHLLEKPADPEDVKSWKIDFDSYKFPQGKPSQDKAYLIQSIEVDAVAFSHYLVDKLFHLKTYIPDSIRDIIDERIKTFDFDL